MIPLGVMAGAHVPAVTGDLASEILSDSPEVVLRGTGAGVYDLTGQVTPGVPPSGTTYSDGVDGTPGAAYYFDNGGLTTGYSMPATFTQCTLESMVRRQTLDRGVVLHSRMPATAHSFTLFFGAPQGAPGCLADTFHAGIDTNGALISRRESSPGAAFTSGQWVHVVATFSASPSVVPADTRIFINGSEVVYSAGANAGSATPPLSNGQPVLVGGHASWKNLSLNAVLDYTAIYSTALSPARILAHARAAGVA